MRVDDSWTQIGIPDGKVLDLAKNHHNNKLYASVVLLTALVSYWLMMAVSGGFRMKADEYPCQLFLFQWIRFFCCH